MNSGLIEYFQKRQLEIYPLEMFSDNYRDIFTYSYFLGIFIIQNKSSHDQRDCSVYIWFLERRNVPKHKE